MKIKVNKLQIYTVLFFMLIIAILVSSIILFIRHESNLEKLTSKTVTCTYLEGHGFKNIPKGNQYYQPRLDRNKNNVACQVK